MVIANHNFSSWHQYHCINGRTTLLPCSNFTKAASKKVWFQTAFIEHVLRSECHHKTPEGWNALTIAPILIVIFVVRGALSEVR